MAELQIGVGSIADILRLSDWAADEGWNPGNTDPHAFMAMDPGGFLIGRVDGEPLVSISVVKYGEKFGFLGFYIVRRQVRGKGFGIRIWRAGMARLAGRNVGLDGVVAQQDNYRKSGFSRAWNNIRHQGAPRDAAPPAGVVLADARDIAFDRLAAYDRRFFPEVRDAFLAPWISLPERASMVALGDGALQGFAAIRASRGSARIGPLYAASPEIAAALVCALAAKLAASTVAVDIPDINPPALRMAEQLGLSPAFETARMYTGPAPAIDRAGLFGVTSLELG